MGIKNLGGVLKSLKFVRKIAKDAVLDRAKDVAVDVLVGVVKGTPEQTSHTIGNWQTSIGSAPTGTVEGTDPGGDKAISRGKAEIESAKFGEDIHIANNLPWINELNAGNAKSKPAGWIEAAIDQAVNKKR